MIDVLVGVVVIAIVVVPISFAWAGAIDRRERATIEAPNVIAGAYVVKALRGRR